MKLKQSTDLNPTNHPHQKFSLLVSSMGTFFVSSNPLPPSLVHLGVTAGRPALLLLLLPPASFKVLSVGVGGDGDVDDEGGLVLDAAAPAVRERSHLHAVGARLPQRLRGEQHPLHVLVPQGEGQRGVLVHRQEGGPGVHHAVLRVGHQPDEVLVGGDAERQRQQLVLQGVRAQGALQVVGGAVLQAEPSDQTRKRRQTIVASWP